MNGFGIVTIELQLRCNELHHIYNELQFYNSCNLSNTTHNVEIQWVASGHCNSKIKLQGQLQNTLFFS
jgi:hypothetical protein